MNDKSDCAITLVVVCGVPVAACGYLNLRIEPQYPGHLHAYYEFERTGCVYQGSAELHEQEEGVLWVYGHHDENSDEAKALLVAYALSGSRGAALWTQART